jgi:aspartate/methionine/tyrosine aminotransferase
VPAAQLPMQQVLRAMLQGIEERDGHPVDTNCLFMTDGASPSVHRIIELLTRNSDDAFLTPIPQYPLCASPPELSDCSVRLSCTMTSGLQERRMYQTHM